MVKVRLRAKSRYTIVYQGTAVLDRTAVLKETLLIKSRNRSLAETEVEMMKSKKTYCIWNGGGHARCVNPKCSSRGKKEL